MRIIDVEEALRWAYRDELPKAPRTGAGPMGVGEGWSAMAAFGQYLTDIDDQRNGFGCVPDFTATTGPHPDAVAIFDVVQALDTIGPVDMPEDWAPIPDLGELGPAGADVVQRGLEKLISVDADGNERLRKTPRQLVEFHAMVGGRPEWVGDKPVRRLVMEHGKPKWFRKVEIQCPGGHPYEIEVDGRDPRRKRPFPDAYRKEYLDPDPAEVVYDRALYQVWHAALGVVAADLAGRLQDMRLIGPAAPAEPWIAGGKAGRVLPSLIAPKVESHRHMGRSRRAARGGA